ATDVAVAAVGQHKRYRRIGVALEAKPTDATMLAEALAMAQSHRAELVLMHVVEGVGGQWYGRQTGDEESREDEKYLENLAEQLRRDLADDGVSVRASLGFGAMPSALIKLARREEIDLMIVGGHGHRAVADIIRGETIDHVRHALKIPVMAIRNESQNTGGHC
ncbi:MAG: universal stress protein, partial [Planctomycetaceae bacterium]